jgi:hypothetical protein
MASTRDPRKPPQVGRESKKTLLVVVLGALCIGAAFLTIAILLAACAGSISSVIGKDGAARIAIQAEVPPLLAARIRSLAAGGGSGALGSLFDTAAIRKSLASKPGLSIIALSQTNPDSIRLELGVKDLQQLASSPELAGSGLITYSKGEGWEEYRFHLGREGGRALFALFPGLDPRLVDALSPPLLEEDPVTEAEYRTMLKSILGSKAMPAMDAASFTLAFTAPGPVIASGGGSLSGSTLTAKVGMVQVLALEKSVELWLRWTD